MNEEKTLKAEFSGELHIGDIIIPCYVLEDGQRLLSQGGMIKSLGMSAGSAGKGGDRLSSFVTGKGLNPFINNDTLVRITSPVKFISSGGVAYGYDANVLADICEAILKAREGKTLQKQQMHIAKMAEILVRGFARVGIIALVDEATGYQEVRDKLALSTILDKYIRDEYRQWTQQFPPDFYKEMFRLRNWTYNEKSIKRPSVIGTYTNDIVYKRLAPGVLKELQERNPTTEKGYRKQRHHQWLTDNIGMPKLREHIYGAIALMKASPNWITFQRLLNRAYQKYGDTIEMDFNDE